MSRMRHAGKPDEYKDEHGTRRSEWDSRLFADSSIVLEAKAVVTAQQTLTQYAELVVTVRHESAPCNHGDKFFVYY